MNRRAPVTALVRSFTVGRSGVGWAGALAVLGLLWPASLAGAAEKARPNVILISLDTLRADHLSCYGYGRRTSPYIDRLGREGVVFLRTVAQAPWTLQSHVSMFTALYPSRHLCGVEGNRARAELVTLAEVLQAQGYVTAAVTGSGKVSKEFDMNQGFDHWIEYGKRQHNDVIFVRKEAFQWLNEHLAQPFFLFLHTYEPHAAYDAPEPFKKMYYPDKNYNGLVKRGQPSADFGVQLIKSKTISFDRRLIFKLRPDERDIAHLIARYDGEITFTDTYLIKRLIMLLREKGVYDNTLIIVTSDHGEALGERNNFKHFEGLYREYTAVPLVMKLPTGFEAPRNARIADATVRIIDIFPTVLDVLGTAYEGELDGRSLVPLMRRAADWNEITISESPNYIAAEDAAGKYKVIYHQATGKWEMFDKRADFDEKNDLLLHRSKDLGDELLGLAEHVRRFMRDHPSRWNNHEYKPVAEGTPRREAPDDPELSEELLERLRSLGYVE